MRNLYQLMSNHNHAYEYNPSASVVVIDQSLLSQGQDVVLKCLADLLHVPGQVVDTTAIFSGQDSDQERD